MVEAFPSGPGRVRDLINNRLRLGSANDGGREGLGREVLGLKSPRNFSTTSTSYNAEPSSFPRRENEVSSKLFTLRRIIGRSTDYSSTAEQLIINRDQPTIFVENIPTNLLFFLEFDIRDTTLYGFCSCATRTLDKLLKAARFGIKM